MDDVWSKLAPHRPLDGGAPEYAQRPESSGAELAAAVRAGWRRIAVVGPMGVGKSTELAAAQQLLVARGGTRSRTIRLSIDKTFDMRRIEAGAVFASILAMLRGGSPHRAQLPTDATRELRRDLARKELRAAGTTALLVDGLEKADEAPARAVAEELFALGDDADIVLVVPASLAYGPGAAILGEDVRLFPVRPVMVSGPGEDAHRGRLFLREVALRHLHQQSSHDSLDQFIDKASMASGGVPRVLLQLLRDAHRHAVIAGAPTLAFDNLNDRVVRLASLEQAMHDHGEQLRRSLLPGDVDALKQAEGQDGTEVPIDRKLRFLLQGHLLEYKVGDRIVMHMAPTLAQALRFPQDFT